MHPLISVVIPVYNAEHSLCRCVDSLLTQSFADFELLLVDDGSLDRSGVICDGYAEKDSRVRVFHKTNGGVSSARNVGIDNARGEYVIHADSDDWVEPTMLSELYAKAVEDVSDLVICDFFVEEGSRQMYSRQMPSSLSPNAVLNDLFRQLHGSCWNKLIRRSCYNGKVRFEEGLSYCEDKLFVGETLAHVKRISYVNRALYHYSQSAQTSLTRTTFTDDTLAARTCLYDLFRSRLKNADENLILQNEVFSKLHDAYSYSDYSSKDFAERFGKYSSQLRNMDNVPVSKKCFWWLSCKGYFRLAKKMDNVWSNIRRTI